MKASADMIMGEDFQVFAAKMRQAGVADAAIRAFEHSYARLCANDSGMIPESSIQPVDTLPRLDKLPGSTRDPAELLSKCVIIKLNGGLGTSMGLDRAKSLLQVKNGFTFLDLIARQVSHLRNSYRAQLHFMLMNSFSTSSDTRAHLEQYPELGKPEEWELIQSRVPKIAPDTLEPVSWAANPSLEWCPPGHGDIYPCLLGSGWLDRLLQRGVTYGFVSNSDNLGASIDFALLSYFAESGSSFLMEVAERTPSDRKGGHLAMRGPMYLLRESAQCPEPDLGAFQDIRRHRYFNTNNLWVRLDHLKQLLDRNGGFVPLPIIRNTKNVDPRNKKSPKVIQLETAMGAAIQCFEQSGAIIVPRTRFAPVKTTSDLLSLRSDAFELTEDWRIRPAAANSGPPPTVDLDPAHYGILDQLEEKLAGGVPSLKYCRELVVRGPIAFNSRNVFKGRVQVTNKASTTTDLAPGEYEEREVQLPS